METKKEKRLLRVIVRQKFTFLNNNFFYAKAIKKLAQTNFLENCANAKTFHAELIIRYKS